MYKIFHKVTLHIYCYKKQDSETNLDVPQGGASLANAEFTIKYFSGLYDTNPEIPREYPPQELGC